MSRQIDNGWAKKVTVVFLICTLGFTSACAKLPTESEIKTGPNIEAGLETDYLYYSPPGPSDEATQEEILLGFINAGTGPQNDYEVARSYLSNNFKTDWNPDKEVLIQDGKPIVTLSDNDTASLLVPISARINERGEYEAVPLGTTRTLDISFTQVAGKWRIDSAPNLTLVIRPVFDVIFKAYSIYFFDNQRKNLVPDVRWFPSRASTGTRLVNALLGGPSEWLQDAVGSAIPNGTRLTLSTVTVTNGIANVDLSARALSASAPSKQLLQSQIRETLLQLGNVFSVQVTIERNAIEQASSGFSSIQLNTPQAIAMVEGGLLNLTSNTDQIITNSKRLIDSVGARDFATNQGLKSIAMTGVNGIYLGRLDKVTEVPRLLALGNSYLEPVVDSQGYTWVTPSSGVGNILVFDPDCKQVAFGSRWLSGARFMSFSISEEGSRAVIVTGDRLSSRVRVAAVVRDESGKPLYLDSPIIPINSTTAFNATWLDPTRIGVLETQGASFVQPWMSMVGGDSKSLQTISNGSKLVGSGLVSTIYLLDKIGTVSQYRGSGWSKLKEQVTDLHFPGN